MLNYNERTTPWAGLGTTVKTAPTSADALKLADLDWTVEPMPLFTNKGGLRRVPDYFANVRETDGKVLGIVTGRYKVCQNAEAFAFTDALINDDVRFETAGQLNGGKRVWLLARLPETQIVGDKVDPYLCFTNTHDGSGAIRVCMTPIRVVCQNTLNLALSRAERAWSARHTGNLDEKLAEAHRCLEMAGDYMHALDEEADRLANTKISEDEAHAIAAKIFAVPDSASDRSKANAQLNVDEFMICLAMPDLARFKGTAWGAINAAADMVGHIKPRRAAETYRENLWGKIMMGHPFVDRIVKEVTR